MRSSRFVALSAVVANDSVEAALAAGAFPPGLLAELQALAEPDAVAAAFESARREAESERDRMFRVMDTAAQYFHLLRRQARVAKQRPLVIMTPKSLLRLKLAVVRHLEGNARLDQRLVIPQRVVFHLGARGWSAGVASASVLVNQLRIADAQVYSEQQLLQVAAFTPGSVLSLADLQAMAARITAHYREHGYFVARAYLRRFGPGRVARLVKARHRAQQAQRVRVGRVAVQLARRAALVADVDRVVTPG